jgi:hypothetical protein
VNRERPEFRGTWYSRADVTDAQTAVAFFLRLPVCGADNP